MKFKMDKVPSFNLIDDIDKNDIIENNFKNHTAGKESHYYDRYNQKIEKYSELFIHQRLKARVLKSTGSWYVVETEEDVE